MPVETAAARADTVIDAILATGQVEALQSIELKPDVEGRLVRILVREGALVGRGTPLFKIDDAELKAQVSEVTAERDLARQPHPRSPEPKGFLSGRARAGRGHPAEQRGPA
jgi:membrane fusion protein (multidrug efflux system)